MRNKKLLKFVMSLALIVGLLGPALSPNAATFSYTPINGPAATDNDVFKFEKNLEMDVDAAIPNATFTYSVAPGTAIDPTATTAGVIPGPTGAVVADVVYVVNDAEATVTVDGTTKTATKETTVDLSAVEFNEPGVYRYIITEGGVNNGVTNDPVATRTLDVYVENDEVTTTTYKFNDTTYNSLDDAKVAVDTWNTNTPDDLKTYDDIETITDTQSNLKIAGYVFYEGTKTDAPSKTATTAEGKSEGYTNVYESYDLTFGKEVKGNFGSLDQYFQFTLVIENIAPGTIVAVDLEEADVTPHESAATTKETTANPTSLTATGVWKFGDNEFETEALAHTAAIGTITEEGGKYVFNGEQFDTEEAAENAAKAAVVAEGKIEQIFYLHDGQYVTLKSVPVNITYTVTEDAEDYVASEGIAAADSRLGVAHTDATSGTVTDSDVKTGFTNTRDTVTPTGISAALTTFAPAVALGLVAIGGIVFFSRKKKVTE